MSDCTPKLSGDQITIKEINQKLTNEILNMQKLISHFDLKVLSSRLQNMTTLELYNEMIKSIEQNVARVILDRAHGDGSSIQSERIQILNTFGDSEIEITEMSMEDINPAADDVERSNDSLYYDVGSWYQDKTITYHLEHELLKKFCRKLETDCQKLNAEVKDLQQVEWKQSHQIDVLHEEIVQKDEVMKQISENNLQLISECKDLNKKLCTLMEKSQFQDNRIETIQKENLELTNTQHVFTEQTGQIQNIIEELFNELRLHKRVLDEIDPVKTILTRQVNNLNVLTLELQEQNQHKTERIDELEKKMESLENILETKWSELCLCTQNKLVAHDKLNKDLKQIELFPIFLSPCKVASIMYAKIVVLVLALAAVTLADPNPQPDPNPGYFNKYGSYVPTVEDYASPLSPYYNAPYAAAYGPYNPYVDYVYPAPYVVARAYY
ncbi:hypothetical protein WDU94_001363 [Cyamophila willieti]